MTKLSPPTAGPIVLPSTTSCCDVVPRISTPAWPLPEITLPAPWVVPPTVSLVESSNKTPSATLATGWVPVASVPMKLPHELSEAARAVNEMPLPSLPEITLRAPWTVPPTVSSDASRSATPSLVLPSGLGPLDVGPDVVALHQVVGRSGPTAVPIIETPSPKFPEMTLRAPGVVPPTVLLVATLLMEMPSRKLPRALVPETSVPM